MTAAPLILIKVAVAGIILAIGMGSTLKDVTYLWRRPGLLLRSVLAMYVLVPLAALALVKVLTLTPAVEIGLLVLAVSAGAPMLPRRLVNIGDGAYIFSLVVTSSLLAILLVPVWLAVLGAQFDDPVSLRPDRVALVLARPFLLPLAFGLLIRRLFPATVERVRDPLLVIAEVVLTACALVGTSYL
jgi:bile acid:Na+ symporter, BASS family